MYVSRASSSLALFSVEKNFPHHVNSDETPLYCCKPYYAAAIRCVPINGDNHAMKENRLLEAKFDAPRVGAPYGDLTGWFVHIKVE